MKYGNTIPDLSDADIERFWACVDKRDCWTWTGPIGGKGYGRFVIDGATFAAHRVAWVLATGAQPQSEVLDHTCHNAAVAIGGCVGGGICAHRRCVNPAHLDDVTQAVNSQRGANGYGSRELCRAGLHDITDPKNVKQGSGGLQCRSCQNEAKRRYDTRKRRDAAFRAAEAERRRTWGEKAGYRAGRVPVKQEGTTDAS